MCKFARLLAYVISNVLYINIITTADCCTAECNLFLFEYFVIDIILILRDSNFVHTPYGFDKTGLIEFPRDRTHCILGLFRKTFILFSGLRTAEKFVKKKHGYIFCEKIKAVSIYTVVFAFNVDKSLTK